MEKESTRGLCKYTMCHEEISTQQTAFSTYRHKSVSRSHVIFRKNPSKFMRKIPNTSIFLIRSYYFYFPPLSFSVPNGKITPIRTRRAGNNFYLFQFLVFIVFTKNYSLLKRQKFTVRINFNRNVSLKRKNVKKRLSKSNMDQTNLCQLGVWASNFLHCTLHALGMKFPALVSALQF